MLDAPPIEKTTENCTAKTQVSPASSVNDGQSARAEKVAGDGDPRPQARVIGLIYNVIVQVANDLA